ncbi:MAG: hypothetical protein KDA24_29665, partial [Deltaproteobacteria bacterium]|nr:hypothetical protein [Deltaproteobacteria bacterium]
MDGRRALRMLGTIGGLAGLAAALGWWLPTPAPGPESKLVSAGLDAATVRGFAERRRARATAPDPSFVVDGAFYQPNLAQGFADPERRRSDLARLVRLGGRTVWLQYLAHGDHSLLEPFPERVDPVLGLLDDAQELGLSVWVGTREDPRLWSEDEVPLSV